MVPKPAGSRVKTNRIDSKLLATSLRGGQLKSIRVPSKKYRNLRHLTQLYKITTIQNRNYKCRIKAMLLMEGIPFPVISKNNHWSNATIKRLETIDCTPAIRFKLDLLLKNLCFYRNQLLEVKRALRSFCRSDSDLADSIRFLLSLPGIGWVIATVLLARVGDWRNLKNVNELGGFIGLTPCENSTGEDVDKGNITRCGDSYLRNILIEGAWSAINKDPELAEFYQRIYTRHPRDRAARKAIVAVARKLTTRIYAVLTQRRIYIPKDREYSKINRTSDKKRKLNAPKDASTLRRTRKYLLKGKETYSPVLSGSTVR
jgi:transposase